MPDTQVSKDDRAIKAVALFCSKPRREHGKKRSTGRYKGWHEHDWRDLVRQLSFIYYERDADFSVAAAIRRTILKAFPDGDTWDIDVNVKGAHERILGIIRDGLSQLTDD